LLVLRRVEGEGELEGESVGEEEELRELGKEEKEEPEEERRMIMPAVLAGAPSPGPMDLREGASPPGMGMVLGGVLLTTVLNLLLGCWNSGTTGTFSTTSTFFHPLSPMSGLCYYKGISLSRVQRGTGEGTSR
jgi:hypothetical protein